MKTKLFYIQFIFSLFFLLPISCKDNRDDKPITDSVSSIEAQRLQAVTIDAKGAITGQTYSGKLNSKDIDVISGEMGKVTFIIPADAMLGNNDFSIINLSFKINLNIKDTQLVKSATETMGMLFALSDSFSQTLDDSSNSIALKNNLQNIKKIFQNASEENKKNMALFYLANKNFYDNVLTNNFGNNFTKGFDYDEDFEANANLNKKKMAVAAFAACNLLMVLAPDPFIKAGAFLGVLVTMKKAYNFGKKFIDEKMLIVNSDFSEKTGPINLTDDVDKNLNFSTQRRSLIANDSNNTLENFSVFFKCMGELNTLITSVNNIAKWLNDHIPFSSFTISSLEVVPQSSSNSTVLLNNTYFNRYKFSITDPNAVLSNVSFLSNGKIKLKAKIVNEKIKNVTTNLNYTYKDDYNTFSGSLPISIVKEQNLLLGSWKHVSTYWCGVCESCIPEGQTVSTYCGPMLGSPSCNWQIVATFSSNLTYEQVGACSGTQTGTYSVNSTFTELKVFESDGNINTYKIDKLTATDLVVSENSDGERIMTYKRQ
ncbi:hypothetical protein [Soonwooa sp.]|uniref:hypothetical protein n=1 Tax=Soonwooa sp. TaxID=1938592 RepID=UPI0026031B94|nr:hypothetical protein [Soonwooa sp.]